MVVAGKFWSLVRSEVVGVAVEVLLSPGEAVALTLLSAPVFWLLSVFVAVGCAVTPVPPRPSSILIIGRFVFGTGIGTTALSPVAADSGPAVADGTCGSTSVTTGKSSFTESNAGSAVSPTASIIAPAAGAGTAVDVVVVAGMS